MNQPALHESLLSRQPILNTQEDLVGYELMLQPAFRSRDSSRAATLVCAAYAELGVRSALGQATAFLPVDLGFLNDDAIEALPPDSVVLELDFDGAPDEPTLERCRAMRERRYSLALNGYAGLDERSSPLLAMLDIIRIDIRGYDQKALSELASPLVKLPLKLLADGVESREVMERCKAIGFQLFQGHYFARPEVVSGRRLSASQAGLIQLINLTGRDAETKKNRGVHKTRAGAGCQSAEYCQLGGLRRIQKYQFFASRDYHAWSTPVTALVATSAYDALREKP